MDLMPTHPRLHKRTHLMNNMLFYSLKILTQSDNASENLKPLLTAIFLDLIIFPNFLNVLINRLLNLTYPNSTVSIFLLVLLSFQNHLS